MGPIILWSTQTYGILSLMQDKWLRSPIFYADSSKVARFCLGLRGVGFPLNPNGHVPKLFLCRCDTDGPEKVEVEYKISLYRRSSTYKRRFLKPQKDAYQSYETDALLLKLRDMSESDIKFVCQILSYDDDKYASSDLIDRSDFDGLSCDFTQMFLESEFSDAVIRIQDHEFNVHKAVLDIRCPALLSECQVKNRQKTTQKCDHCTEMLLLLCYIYSGQFASRDVPERLHLLLKRYKDSIFEHLFPYFPIELHTRTSFEDNRVFIKWDIETFLMCKQNKEYRYIITEGQPSTWFSITFLEDEAGYIEFAVHKMCKKTIAFVHCEISFHPSTNLEVDVATIFRGNHLFIDDQPWKVKLGHTLRIRQIVKAEPRYFSILFHVTDVKPTNSVEKVRYSFISDFHIHAVDNVFQLSRDMERLYKNPIHSDVTLLIKDKRIPGHKAILSARSKRFRKTLQQNNFQTEIPINDLDEKVALSMIYYIYSAQVVDLETDLALELHKAADLYKIDILKRKCSRYLELSLTAANVGEILLFADAQNDSELKCSIYNFIKTHPSDVLESKQSMGIMRSYHYLHLDALKEICRHLAEKSAKEKYTESVKIPQI